MFVNLFGYQPRVSDANGYQTFIDVCLLPYNPLEPGRFRIIRDFRMTTAPGWRSDVYRRVTIVQSRTNSYGKIYFGPASSTSEMVYPVYSDSSTGSFFVGYLPSTLSLPTITVGGVQISPERRSVVDGTTYVGYVIGS